MSGIAFVLLFVGAAAFGGACHAFVSVGMNAMGFKGSLSPKGQLIYGTIQLAVFVISILVALALSM